MLRDAVLPCVLCFGRQPWGGTGNGYGPPPGLSPHLSPCPDLCHPEGCAAAVPSPDPLDVDLALVVDNATPGMPAEQLEAVGDLFHRLLGHLQLAGPDPAQHGTRIALVLTGPSAPGQDLAEVPFGMLGSGEQLWQRLRLALVPRTAAASAGGTVAWTLRHIFPQSSGNRLRVLFVVGMGTAVLWDGEAQQALAPFARCEDFGVLLLSLGRAGMEQPEAAVPEMLPAWRYHCLRLGSVHPPEMGYAERTVLGFLRRLRGEWGEGVSGGWSISGCCPDCSRGRRLSIPKTSLLAPPSHLCYSFCSAVESSQRPGTPGCPQELRPSGAGTSEPPPGTPVQ